MTDELPSDETPSISHRAEGRTAAKARRAKRNKRRASAFELIASGYSHQQVASAFGVSLGTVRRDVDRRSPKGRSRRPTATSACRPRA
jgi:transposase